MAGRQPIGWRWRRPMTNRLPRRWTAMYLPTARNPVRPCGWRSMSAKRCVGWPLRMDSSAHSSRFPIPNGTAVREIDEDKAMTKSERRSERLWSVPLALSDVPDSGRHFDLVADAQVRAAVAKRAGLAALPRLEASFDVTLHGRGGLHVGGRVSATVGHICVVTLDPLENEIDESIDLEFMPAGPVPLCGGAQVAPPALHVPACLVARATHL